MGRLPRFLPRAGGRKHPHLINSDLLQRALALAFVALLVLAPLSFRTAAQTIAAPQIGSAGTKAPPLELEGFIIFSAAGEVVCRQATPVELQEMRQREPQPRLRPLNQPEPETPGLYSYSEYNLAAEQPETSAAANAETAGLRIILQATEQLNQASPEVRNAFIRAAAAWEAIVSTPVTLTIEVDYGPTNFGQEWSSERVLGSTSGVSYSVDYQTVRSNLLAVASSQEELTLYHALPNTPAVPTDIGDTATIHVPSSIRRAFGLAASPGEPAVRIGFNSNFPFDFDPSDGTDSNKHDFHSIAVHEIGHALGFTSRAGSFDSSTPAAQRRLSVWDLFRFRPGINASTFSTAPRVLSAGTSITDPHIHFDGGADLPLSTGGPNGAVGDMRQSSHWKDDAYIGKPQYVGIMDPTIASGTQEQMTVNDQRALSFFGYFVNVAGQAPPAPPAPPANDNFVNARSIGSGAGSVTFSNRFGTKEQSEPSHDPGANPGGGASVWFRWLAPSSGTATFHTQGSGFDTLLAVYTGPSVSALTPIVKNDDVQDGVIRHSSVTFSVTAGTVYQIAVDGWNGEAGNGALHWNLPGAPAGNQIDEAQFFVRQQYLDFLSREPDSAGLQFWVNDLNACGADAACLEAKRTNVSAAFFLSIEFQETGYLVYRFYRASFPESAARPRGFPRYTELMTDTRTIGQGVVVGAAGWETLLENNKQAFARAWVQRSEFVAAYQQAASATGFVNQLFQTAGVTPTEGERQAAISAYNSSGDAMEQRARALRSVAESQSLRNQEFNRAFVLMQYFGYLRRNPNDAPDTDFGGYDFWLGKLNQANGNFIESEMVKAFLTSLEYRGRFGP